MRMAIAKRFILTPHDLRLATRLVTYDLTCDSDFRLATFDLLRHRSYGHQASLTVDDPFFAPDNLTHVEGHRLTRITVAAHNQVLTVGQHLRLDGTKRVHALAQRHHDRDEADETLRPMVLAHLVGVDRKRVAVMP